MVDVLSNIILLFLITLFLKSFFESYNNPRKHFSISEYVTLQPLEKDAPIQQTATRSFSNPANMNAAKRAPKQPKPKIARNQDGYTSLQQDCFDALKSVGIKTVKERKYLVNAIFNDNDPKTIQEFLHIAFRGKSK